MSVKHKIILTYTKDLSVEIPDVQTYLLARERISKYKIIMDISSKPVKNKMIEVFTKLKYTDVEESKKKALFELLHSTLVEIEDINIGETVYAIGNPQGLGQSVSMGIISAIGRKFINKEGSFIQTDASINPGNSGGALVDSNGNLLGVINFIESTTGGNQGLNFAIPIDVVSESYSKILKETKR